MPLLGIFLTLCIGVAKLVKNKYVLFIIKLFFKKYNELINWQKSNYYIKLVYVTNIN